MVYVKQARTPRFSDVVYGASLRLAELAGTAEEPGLYVRLFDVVEPGSALQLVGRTRRSSASAPEPIRLEVMDTIDDIARTVLELERIQRRALGLATPVRRSSARLRQAWGLPPHDPAAGGCTPDERILDAMRWLTTRLPDIDAAPEAWREHVADELHRLARHARKLCGLSRAWVQGATCPYCGLESVHLDPDGAEDALCVNVTCRDENGNTPVWHGWVQWLALAPAPATDAA